MKKRIEIGDVCWLEDGRECALVASDDDGEFIVELVSRGTPYDRSEGGGRDADCECRNLDGGLRRATKIFREPPVEVFDAAIAERREELRAISVRIGEMHGAVRAYRGMLERIGKRPPLDRLEDFLEGRITHFVIGDTMPQVKTYAEALALGDRDRQGRVRMLSLTGIGNLLEWRIYQYFDGSGDSEPAIPCTSLEQANAQARSMMDRLIATTLDGNAPNIRWLAYVIERADAFGAEVPDQIRRVVRERDLSAAHDEVAAARAALAKSEAALAALSPPAEGTP